MTSKDPNPFGFRVQGGTYGHPIKRGELTKRAIAIRITYCGNSYCEEE